MTGGKSSQATSLAGASVQPASQLSNGKRSNASPYIGKGGKFWHPCAVCGAFASFGQGVDLLRYQRAMAADDANASRFLGVWHCSEHLPADFWAVKRRVESGPEIAGMKGASAAEETKHQFKKGQGVLL